MALLYEKQLAKGGIVNTQEQDDTIDETWVSQVSGAQVHCSLIDQVQYSE